MLSTRWIVFSCAFAIAASVAPEVAARRQVVSWSHVMPCSIDGFQLRSGASAANLSEVIDVGRPRQAGGHFSYELEVADGEELFVCVAAIRGSEVSECSNQVSIAASSEDNLRSEPAPDANEHRRWCEDFGVGSHLGDWLDTAPGSSLVPSPGLFSIASVDGANQALITTATDDDAHSHFLGIDSDGTPSSQWSEYEYSGEMRFSAEAGGVGVTIYSRYNLATGYYRLGRDPSAGSFDFVRDQLGPSYKCVAGAAETPAVSDTWYAFRIRAQDEGPHTTLKAKVWRADKREPEGFQWICTDSRSNRQLSGAVGVWTAGTGAKLWDNLSVSEFPEPLPSDPLGIPGKPRALP